jgi:phytoene synthase
VLAAANIYGAIARRVAARGDGAWDSRTVIHKPSKLVFVAKALVECLDQPAERPRDGLWTRPGGT